MKKISKNRKTLLADINLNKVYEPDEAIKLLKEKKYSNFEETIDIAINLAIDSNKTDQNIKGVVNLPKGTGKKIKVAVITNETNENIAKDAGADFYNANKIIESVESNKIEFDTLIASPDMMPSLGKIAKILGPRGLMPNPKMGTVTKEIAKAIKEVKSGQVKFKNDKAGIVHAGIAKTNFANDDILMNLKTFYNAITKNKPDSVKGSFIKKVTIASTMGVGLTINQASLR